MLLPVRLVRLTLSFTIDAAMLFLALRRIFDAEEDFISGKPGNRGGPANAAKMCGAGAGGDVDDIGLVEEAVDWSIIDGCGIVVSG